MSLLVSDLDAAPGGRGIAALANYCLDASASAGGLGGSDSALHRLEGFFRTHVRVRPSTAATIPWKTRAELETCMNWYGPTCSAADIVTVLAGMSSGLNSAYAGVTVD